MGARVGFLDPKPAGGEMRQPLPGVLIPADAVRTDNDGATIFVYADGKVERRRVTLGPDVAGQRRVLSGLRDGERVVVAPPPTLVDGQAVKPAEPR
jgi:multidrug efflux pump subunit AcrA (membrane-fusion protein)